jgi:hypothetical protein
MLYGVVTDRARQHPRASYTVLDAQSWQDKEHGRVDRQARLAHSLAVMMLRSLTSAKREGDARSGPAGQHGTKASSSRSLWSADANRAREGGCIKARYTRISTPAVGKNGSISRRLVCLTVVVVVTLPSSPLLTSCSLLTAHPSRNNNNLIVNHSNQSINQFAYYY